MSGQVDLRIFEILLVLAKYVSWRTKGYIEVNRKDFEKFEGSVEENIYNDKGEIVFNLKEYDFARMLNLTNFKTNLSLFLGCNHLYNNWCCQQVADMWFKFSIDLGLPQFVSHCVYNKFASEPATQEIVRIHKWLIKYRHLVDETIMRYIKLFPILSNEIQLANAIGNIAIQ